MRRVRGRFVSLVPRSLDARARGRGVRRVRGRFVSLVRRSLDGRPRSLSGGRSSARRRNAHGGGTSRVEHLEHVVGRRHALRRGVELHADLAQRQIRLGREQQHEEADRERQRPVDEPEPDRDCDDRDRDRREELEHETREERDAEHAHRLAAVLVGDTLDGRGGTVLPAEDLEGRQALHGVGEARREALQRAPLLLLHRARGEADQNHEDRDEGKGEQHGEARDPVLPPHHRQDQRRRDDGLHQLRQVAAEVRLERFESAPGGHRKGSGVPGAEPFRPQDSDRLDECGAQLALHTRGGAGRHGFARPQQHRARDHHDRERCERRRQLGQRHPVDGAGDRARQQPRERDDDARLRHREGADRDEEPARGPRVPQQARVDRLARQRSGSVVLRLVHRSFDPTRARMRPSVVPPGPVEQPRSRRARTSSTRPTCCPASNRGVDEAGGDGCRGSRHPSSLRLSGRAPQLPARSASG